MMHC
jgi:hypothetical protein